MKETTISTKQNNNNGESVREEEGKSDSAPALTSASETQMKDESGESEE